MPRALQRIFEPGSVAIVGASRDPTKRGFQAVRALVEGGYTGRVHPVNPNGGEVLGLPIAASLDDIAEVPDLALICTPAESVPEILEHSARRGIPGAVILAAGFRESGETGAALERKVLDIARRTGVRLVGPNTSGVLNTQLGLNLVGVRDVPAGRLAILSQSGNIGLALMRFAASRSQGISFYVGVGNEADIAFHEYLAYLEEAEHTSAVLMYVEGFQDGERFLEVARRMSHKKPIALLKGGRSQRGGVAARSHTGAIAGSSAVLRAALQAAGVHLVARSDELLSVGETLAGQPAVEAGKGVVVFSDGGGYGALVADALSEFGVQAAELSEVTRRGLRELLGPAAAVTNPIDVAGAGDRNPAIFAEALELVTGDPACGGVVMSGLFGGYALRFADELAEVEAHTADRLAAIAAGTGKPLVVQSLYTTACPPPLERLGRLGVPVVESLETAASCISAVYRRGLFLADEKGPRARRAATRQVEPAPIAAARTEKRDALLETEARHLLVEYGVPVAEGTLCPDLEAVVKEIDKAEGPVAIKIVSPAILHKSDAGGVALNVQGIEDGAAAYDRVVESASAYARARGVEPEIRGVLVAPMLATPISQLIVGAKRDPQFGPVVTVGAGGLAVELLGDSSLRVLPISRQDGLEMLDELRLAPILRGYRGGAAACTDCLLDIMLGVSRCILENPGLTAIEANPVFVYHDSAVAVDVRALLNDIGPRPTQQKNA